MPTRNPREPAPRSCGVRQFRGPAGARGRQAPCFRVNVSVIFVPTVAVALLTMIPTSPLAERSSSRATESRVTSLAYVTNRR